MFKFVPSTTTYTKLIDVCNYSISHPTGDLCLASNGKLYGMAMNWEGKEDDQGAIFEYFLGNQFQPPSMTVTRFSGTEGCTPSQGSSLIVDNGGDPKLLGMTYNGYGINQNCNSGSGNIFEYNITNHTINNKFTFSNGEHPSGSLLYFSDYYYGLTSGGGDYNQGTLFKYNYSTNTVITVHSFHFDSFNNIFDGYYPQGSLMEFSSNLYGMTALGGNNWVGTIFAYGTSYAKKVNLKCSNNKSLNFVPDDEVESDIIIYPNPTSNYIIIKNSEFFKYELLNIFGEKVLSGEQIKGDYKLDIRSLPEGNYVMKIINNSRIFNKKICIIR